MFLVIFGCYGVLNTYLVLTRYIINNGSSNNVDL